MAGYSWINQMDFTHPGTVAIGSYQNASKERGEKKAREMQFAKDQKMLDKLTLEIAHLPEQQAQSLRLGEAQIGSQLASADASRASTAYQQQMTALQQQFGGAQMQAAIDSSRAAANASNIGAQGAMINNQIAQYGLLAASLDAANRKRLSDQGITSKAGQDMIMDFEANVIMDSLLNSMKQKQQNVQSGQNNQGTTDFVIPETSGKPIQISEMQSSVPTGQIQERLEINGVKQPKSPLEYLPRGQEKTYFDMMSENLNLKRMSPEHRGAVGAGLERASQLNVEKWDDIQTKTSEEASAANTLADAVKTSLDEYNKLSPIEKGTWFGEIKGFSDAAKIVDQQLATVLLNNLDAMKGALSDKDVNAIKETITSRKMDDRAFRDISRILLKASERPAMKQRFIENAMRDPNVTAQQALQGWDRFENENSVYDAVKFDKAKRTAELEAKQRAQ